MSKQATVVPGETTLDTFALDLAALLDHLGVDDVVIGGLSMGSRIVIGMDGYATANRI